jgi:hypothetical protein
MTKNSESLMQTNEIHHKSILRKFYCGFIAGIFQAGLFNPWDRALYLSVKNHSAFLCKENFKHPFSGLAQTLFQRSLSSSLYFPLEDIFLTFLHERFNEIGISKYSAWMTFAAGTLAGASNGFLLNPLSAVKVFISLLLLFLHIS